jgi:PPP family 3-phenylpropionic acid transporter
MNNKSDKLLSLQIAGLQGFYWMIFCPIYSFASVYLLSRDFSNQKIGWMMASSSVAAIILQPVLGALIDRYKKYSPKFVMTCLSAVCLILLCGVIWLDVGMLGMAVMYVGVLALLLTMQPLVNALTFEYINAGHDVSFGVTRAAGSILFAVLSTLLGVWVGKASTAILPIICLVLFACYFLLLQTFNTVSTPVSADKRTGEDERIPLDQSVGFLRRYDRFVPFLFGCMFIFLFHNVINTFLAQIIASVNGNDTQFGISLTIAAVCELPAFLGFSWLAARIETRSLLKASGIFYALRSFIFLLAGSVWMVNFGQVLQGLSFAIFIPGSVYYINQIMHEKDRVKGQTFVTGASTVGSFFGSVIGGWLLDHSGVHGLLIYGSIAAVIGGFLLVYAIRKPKPQAKMQVIEEPS